MVEAPTTQERFQMVGARSVILDGPIGEAIEQQIDVIEDSVASVPDFAFDLSKALVESVCKTVLKDNGQTADRNWDMPRLLKETTRCMPLLPRDYPDPAKPRSSLEKTVRGLLQTIQGLCELRNKHGLASHGRDVHSARLDVRHAMLAAQAADTIVSFLYRIHRDARVQTPGARVYYEDHADFNDAFDRANEPICLVDVELLPSHVLFRSDRVAYKAALNEYLADKSGAGDRIANGALGEPDSETE